MTVKQMELGIVQLQRRINDLEAFDINLIQGRWGPEVEALQASLEETLASVFGHRTVEYNRYGEAFRLDSGPSTLSIGPNFGGRARGDDVDKAREYVREGIKRSILLLRTAVRGLEERVADSQPVAQHSEASSATITVTRSAFVVHGHDEGMREAVARFLESLDFKAIILHEQANQGRTVIEKVEAHGQTGFAVVLLSPDDEGCKKGGIPAPRVRQNVLLELGYFIGLLG